jgi:DNA recombination protein Rad52
MQHSTFTPEQVALMAAGLPREVVKQRAQSYGSQKKLSYVEGWWVIKEANRIFGFDRWDQELVEIRNVVEKPRKIGENKRDGWGVTYVAKVRITVNGIIREGIGSGHGIDVDLGLAHESAIKEAATDAMKRAMITFGNAFGLALYDKDQRDVTDERASTLTPDQIAEQRKAEAEAEEKANAKERQEADEKFAYALAAKFEHVKLDSIGIATVAVIARVYDEQTGGCDFSKLGPSGREKLLNVLTPAYAELLNAGMNKSGEPVPGVQKLVASALSSSVEAHESVTPDNISGLRDESRAE